MITINSKKCEFKDVSLEDLQELQELHIISESKIPFYEFMVNHVLTKINDTDVSGLPYEMFTKEELTELYNYINLLIEKLKPTICCVCGKEEQDLICKKCRESGWHQTKDLNITKKLETARWAVKDEILSYVFNNTIEQLPIKSLFKAKRF